MTTQFETLIEETFVLVEKASSIDVQILDKSDMLAQVNGRHAEDTNQWITKSSGKSFINIDVITHSIPNLVSLQLNLIVMAERHQIPIIFNRTGVALSDASSLESIPHSQFCIGFFTSGTTGKPKLIFKSLSQLCNVHGQQANINSLCDTTRKHYDSKWLLCYHPFTYAGFQVVLQALIHGETLLTYTNAPVVELAKLGLEHNANAISASPSFFKSLLMSWGQQKPTLKSITFGGEVVEQDILDLAKQHFTQATIRHIYATTETGIIMTIRDGVAGFPASFLDSSHHGWRLDVVDGQLSMTKNQQRISSGDLVCYDNNYDRYFFTGRSDNIVNVGGYKVDLEMLERRIISLNGVFDACVFAKKNPVTGYLVCCEIQLDEYAEQSSVTEKVNTWKDELENALQPRIVRFVDEIKLNDSGKKQRLR